MQKIAEESGCIQPKKKAWLFAWCFVPVNEDITKLKTANLKYAAQSDGYDVIGTTITIGRGKKIEDAMIELINREPPANGADVIYIKGMRGISLNGYGKAAELYDRAKAKGIEIVAADGSLQGLKDDYSTYSAIIRSLDNDENRFKPINWNDALTPKM